MLHQKHRTDVSKLLRNPLKIFTGLLKLVPVFFLGTENVVGGVGIVVVVCGQICGKHNLSNTEEEKPTNKKNNIFIKSSQEEDPLTTPKNTQSPTNTKQRNSA